MSDWIGQHRSAPYTELPEFSAARYAWRHGSQGSGNAVEIAYTPFGVAVRHRAAPAGAALVFPTREWQAFERAVRRGELDDLLPGADPDGVGEGGDQRSA